MRSVKTIALVLVFASIIAGSYRFIFSSETASNLETDSGRQFKGFILKDRADKSVAIDLNQEPIVLHFWATWCPPCLAEIKEVIEAAKKMADKPVRWVFVGAADKWDEAVKYIPDATLSSRIISVMDKDLKTIESFGTFQYPETYLYSAEGKLLKKWVGAQDWSHLDLNEWLKTK